MESISLKKQRLSVRKDDFIGIRVSSEFKAIVEREAYKRRCRSLSDFFESVVRDSRVKVSPESSLSMRLSAVESKLDRILSFLVAAQESPSINPQIVQDAIRAHIRGDRGPMEALEKIWQMNNGVMHEKN